MGEWQLPVPGSPAQVLQSVWADALGLPTGLNCPQVGGISSLLCGGVSPVMDLKNNNMPGCKASKWDPIQYFSLLRIGEHPVETALGAGGK